MSGSPRYDGALRDIQSPTGLRYRIHETPEDLAVITPRVAQEPEIWIDTETADWNTKSPRLSLVQLRLGDGSLHVLDVLSPEMAAAYHTTFAPRVIAAPRITKWAHYARFERRILGADFVQGLQCTFEIARRVPYHRLPLRSLRLAALVHHLCGTAVDKTLQRADWGQRPLSAEQLDYAAWDPEWCYRVHRRLDPLLSEALRRDPALGARRESLARGHVDRDQDVHDGRLARALRGIPSPDARGPQGADPRARGRGGRGRSDGRRGVRGARALCLAGGAS